MPLRRAWTPVILTLLVVAGAVASVTPLSVTGSYPESGVRLHHSIAYLAMSPVARVLDELSLLEKNQHIAVGVSVLCLTVLAGVIGGARGRASLFTRARRTLTPIVGGLAALLSTYAFGALVPRPMSALVVADRSAVVVDFHSHTSASHDGRWNFSAEDNRDWHSGAGFHAAYVTDHQTMRAWSELAAVGALAPPTAPDARASVLFDGSAVPARATLLPGVETHLPGVHINILGVGAEHSALLPPGGEVDTMALLQLPRGGTSPLVLATLPFDTALIAVQSRFLDAIELTDASPRGLAFSRLHRARLLALADSLEVPLVASSNNHGWGRTAASWTLVRLPGWPQLAPLALDTALRVTLRSDRGAVSVVERTRLSGADNLASVSLTLPMLAVHVVRILGPAERVVWLLWIWLFWLIGNRRGTGPGSGPATARLSILRRWIWDSRAR